MNIRRSKTVLGMLAIVPVLSLAARPLRALEASAVPPDEPVVHSPMGNISVPFVANEGQVDERVAFYARTFAGTAFVTKMGEIVYSLPEARHARAFHSRADDTDCEPGLIGWTLVERMVGGQPVPRIGDKSETNVSVFSGNDRTKWCSTIATYQSVDLGEVWPGVRVKLKAHGRNVEKLFTLGAGVSTDRIHIAIDGGAGLHVGDDGSLVIETDLGQVRLTKPVAWQDGPDGHPSVDVAYQVQGDQYGFRLGAHDASLPVSIDPLVQATYLGGSSDGDTGYAMAIHPSSGDVYVTGFTSSTNFPGTPGGAQATSSGGPYDAFVARLAPNLTSLTQATYLGGSSTDGGDGIAVHPSSGDVYVTGTTFSTDFPGTTGGAQAILGGIGNAFVARLAPNLASLTQATYLGGTGGAGGYGIAIHPNTGDVYVTGYTTSTNFPGTTGGAQATSGGDYDTFVARLAPSLTSLIQATYLGGGCFDSGGGIGIHPSTGDVYVTGGTCSPDLPGTTGGAQVTFGGGWDAFVARLAPNLTSLTQATYLGGTNMSIADSGVGIAIHPSSGDVYVAGYTGSADFPGMTGGAQASFGGGTLDAFAARLAPNLTSLTQATYLGGSSNDQGLSMAIHPSSGDVYVTGDTYSTSFPGTTGGAQASSGGNGDAFVARLTPNLTSLTQATYLGGRGYDDGEAIAIHPSSGDVYAKSHNWGPVVIVRHDAPPGVFFNVSGTTLPPTGEKRVSVIYTQYRHLQKIQVEEDDPVYGGTTQIGEVGLDCAFPTPHLHFEVKNQAAIDKEILKGVGGAYSGEDKKAPNRYRPSQFIRQNPRGSDTQ